MLEELREEIVEYGVRLSSTGLAPAAAGNLSVLDPESGLIAIKPSAVMNEKSLTSYEKIRPEDIVIVDKEGNIVEGRLKPSTETPMHTYMYRSRPNIRAVIHTHAPFSTVLAVINKELPILTQDLAMFASDTVKVAPFRVPGTKDLGEIADKYMGDSDVLLLQNHGTLAVGNSLQTAYAATWALERAAMSYCYALMMGGNFSIIPSDAAIKLRMMLKGG